MATVFFGAKILVIGGAGFIGSNMVKRLQKFSPRQIVVVNNLLSAERINMPDEPEIELIEGSITVDAILSCLQDDLDYIFHLATFHGNQNSIYDPLADHENNTLTTLKLFERIKSFKRLKKAVYSGAGYSVAEKTFNKAHATQEDAPVLLQMYSPYSISNVIGEFYSVYYHRQHCLPIVRACFQGEGLFKTSFESYLRGII